MNDEATDLAQHRIERALARIEAAARRQAAGRTALAERHAALRRSIEQAIAALDTQIAIEGDD